MLAQTLLTLTALNPSCRFNCPINQRRGERKTPHQARVAYFIFMRHNHAHTHSTITIGLMKSTNNHFTITGTEVQKGENNSSCRCAVGAKSTPFSGRKAAPKTSHQASQPASKERAGIGNGSPAASYPARTRTIWFLRHKRLCPRTTGKNIGWKEGINCNQARAGRNLPLSVCPCYRVP